MDTKTPSNVTSFLQDSSAATLNLHEALVSLGSAATYRKYLGGAGATELNAFFEDLGRVDLDWVDRHRHALLHQGKGLPIFDLEPVEPGVIDGPDVRELTGAGRKSLERGEWSAVVFSGGAATRFFAQADAHPRARELVERLGHAPPKGLFPITPVMGFSFLDLFAAQGLAAGVASGRMPYLVLMSSRLTEAALREWADTAHLWGHPRRQIMIMPQAEHPRLDGEGDLIARPDGRLIFTGDGHGGVFRALLETGSDGRTTAMRLASTGVRHLVLHNVDNAAANSYDEARIGYHVLGGYRLTLSVVPRQRPDEKVGLVVKNTTTGGVECVEYSVCPPDLAGATGADGGPVFSLAHICTNIVDLSTIRPDLEPTLYTGKKVKVGEEFIESSTYEMLNQDLSRLMDARDVGVLLLDRESFFLPTKQMTGPDSLETTVKALADHGADILRAAGAHVHESALIEIDPCLGNTPAALKEAGIGPGWKVGRDARVYLGVRHGTDGSAPFGSGLTVGEGAVFKVSAELPYGRLRFDPSSRVISEDPETAGRVRIGKDVTVMPAADVCIVLKDNGIHAIPDGMNLT
ncbi:MAG: hypothetical protein GXP54_00030 [Deltaproteobacteria bacterium]|nr:hypothetical protein [Deltaproteobacteria bacterium]